VEAVWPNTVVGDDNLNVPVANLRRLPGAEAIVTVPGRGFTFALYVRHDAPALALPDRPSVVVPPFETPGGRSGVRLVRGQVRRGHHDRALPLPGPLLGRA
jgi:hypothetical protein